MSQVIIKNQFYQQYYYFQGQNKNLEMTEKSYFGCIDLRNAKFQGSIRDGQPDGLGLLLDNQHLFALTNWKNDVPYGPSLIIYPNRDYLYGKIKNRKLQQLCVFVKATGVSYIFNFINGVSDKIAYSDGNNSVIQLISGEGKLKAGAAASYKGEAGRWKAVSQILGAPVPQYMKGVKSYVHEMLQKQFYDVVECSQISGLAFVGFKNTSSLGVKFDKEERVRQVGNWQLFPRNLQFGRKYEYTGKGVRTEQGRFVQPERVLVYEQGRPVQAMRLTEEYFKRGTNFKNAFFKMGVFEQISSYLKDIERQVVHLSFLQFGQKILEGREEEVELVADQYYKNKEYTVSEIKNQIYAAVQRRNGGMKGSPARLSREKTQRGTDNTYKVESSYAHNISIKREVSPLSRSRSKQYLYTDGVKKTGDEPLGLSQRKRLSEFQVSRQYSPKPAYYPVTAVQNGQIVDISAGLLSNRYDNLHEDMLIREKLRQGMMLDIVRKNVSPIMVERRMTYSPSPYDGLRRGRTGEGVAREVTPEAGRYPENFTLGGGKGQSEQQKFDNYMKYKNRNKTPSKIEKESLMVGKVKDQSAYIPKNSEIPERRSEIPEHRALQPKNNIMVGQEKGHPMEGAGQKQYEPHLASRHKKIFKYL